MNKGRAIPVVPTGRAPAGADSSKPGQAPVAPRPSLEKLRATPLCVDMVVTAAKHWNCPLLSRRITRDLRKETRFHAAKARAIRKWKAILPSAHESTIIARRAPLREDLATLNYPSKTPTPGMLPSLEHTTRPRTTGRVTKKVTTLDRCADGKKQSGGPRPARKGAACRYRRYCAVYKPRLDQSSADVKTT